LRDQDRLLHTARGKRLDLPHDIRAWPAPVAAAKLGMAQKVQPMSHPSAIFT